MDWLLPIALISITAVNVFLLFAWRGVMQRSEMAISQLIMQRSRKVDGQVAESRSALKMQAYERLSLLMERSAVPNLILRSPAGELKATPYTASLLHTLRTEFEHNVTQQVYVSDQLWQIILLARDNVSQLITRAAEGAESGEQVANRLLHMSQNQPQDAVAVAQAAIRREAGSVLEE
ncbi:MAG: hypothetical protein AAFY36_03750 [Bacteroidota bacterium]